MRLARIGFAAIAVTFGWCSYAQALDDTAHHDGSRATRIEQSLRLAPGVAHQQVALLQQDSAAPFATELTAGGNRPHLSGATSLLGDSVGVFPNQSAFSAALAPGGHREQPKAWLMGAVILFLIGYQLRRKHRLLRPYRFHRV